MPFSCPELRKKTNEPDSVKNNVAIILRKMKIFKNNFIGVILGSSNISTNKIDDKANTKQLLDPTEVITGINAKVRIYLKIVDFIEYIAIGKNTTSAIPS